MNYLALGDSISIDDYTGVPNGGAVSQFARLIGANELQDLTRDGRTTDGVLESLTEVTSRPDVITLTVGGNDFLQNAYRLLNPVGGPSGTWDDVARLPLENLTRVADRLSAFGCWSSSTPSTTRRTATMLWLRLMGRGARAAYNPFNDGIRDISRRYGFLLSDLEKLFHGHGAAGDPRIVSQIEPNHAGATAIARHWHQLYSTT